MSTWAWIAFYVAQALFWLWIARWGGSDWLAGTFTSGMLVHARAPYWGREGLELFARLSLAGSSVWFVLGLFDPNLRFL
jgi:hypothetical protein